MNKHDKQKSSEIRAIMRTDKWGRMTYKEARRKWRKGTRVVWFSPDGPWMAFNNIDMSLSNRAMKNFAIIYLVVVKYANRRFLEVGLNHDPTLNAIGLRFSGIEPNGRRFGIETLIDIFELDRMYCPIEYMTKYLIDRVERSLSTYYKLVHPIVY